MYRNVYNKMFEYHNKVENQKSELFANQVILFREEILANFECVHIWIS